MAEVAAAAAMPMATPICAGTLSLPDSVDEGVAVTLGVVVVTGEAVTTVCPSLSVIVTLLKEVVGAFTVGCGGVLVALLPCEVGKEDEVDQEVVQALPIES